MAISHASKVGRRGTFVIPAKMRRRYGLKDGSAVVAEEREDGILIRPAEIMPVEVYTPRRMAEFHLNNAVDQADYIRAVKEVRSMGLDPSTIPHEKPRGR